MKIKKFFKIVTEALDIKFSTKEESKKRALRDLLIQLNSDKANLKKILKIKNLNTERKEEVKEELKIYTMHIKKGEEILQKKLAKDNIVVC